MYSYNNIKIEFSPARVNLAEQAQGQAAIQKAESERQTIEAERLAKEKTFESSVLAEFYKYRRIEEPFKSRVLFLNPGKESERLAGRLEDLLVGETRGYKALSYVWGEPHMTDVIFLDGKRLAITESLGAALRRLRPAAGHAPLPIWVDQICINQKDTIERSQQVRLMHSIFMYSGQVLVWLGSDPGSHAGRAFQLVGALKSIFDNKLLTALCKEAGAEFNWIPKQYWKSLKELSELPWFRRAWIPQEIGTDAPATVHWGSESIEWEILHCAMKKLEGHWELKKRHKINTTAITLLYGRFVKQSHETAGDQARRNFVYQLCLSARNLATDPRDYVFSQLGHYSAWVASENVRIIQPDYDNSVGAVYHEIAIRGLKTHSALMILNAVADNGEPRPPLTAAPQLPSWVPRWDTGRFHNLIGYPGRYKASGSRVSKVTFEDEYKTLVIKGILLDIIDKISDKFSSHCFTPNSSKSALVHSAWYLGATGSLSTSRQIFEFTSRGKYLGDASTSMLKAFLDTLAPETRVVELSSDTSAYHSGITVLDKLFPSFHFSSKNNPRKSALEPGKKSNPSVWMQVAEENAVNRKFAITRKGHFVMAPPTAKQGDGLCILTGGETPYILRRDSNGEQYQFIGEAYARGWMDGEALNLVRTGQLLESTFRIR